MCGKMPKYTLPACLLITLLDHSLFFHFFIFHAADFVQFKTCNSYNIKYWYYYWAPVAFSAFSITRLHVNRTKRPCTSLQCTDHALSEFLKRNLQQYDSWGFSFKLAVSPCFATGTQVSLTPLPVGRSSRPMRITLQWSTGYPVRFANW